MKRVTHGLLAIQHVLAMFGATVLVPFLTGMDASLALLGAGLGTLIFHWVTGGVVPVFLGSSFAFIGVTALILKQEGLGAVKMGLVAAGFTYLLLARFFRSRHWISTYFPPVVSAPLLVLIGLRLVPVATGLIQHSSSVLQWKHVAIAGVIILTVLVVSVYARGLLRIMPVLLGLLAGYLAAMLMGVVDWAPVGQAPWWGWSPSTWEALRTPLDWSWNSIVLIAPISLVVLLEHCADIQANGAVVGQNFLMNPGLHRTLTGDGLATIISGVLGAPANTTYSENTSVLALTGNYNPAILRTAAAIAILLSMFGKFGALLQTIPSAVMGGMGLVLMGQIATTGLKLLSGVSLDIPRNALLVGMMLVLGLGISELTITEHLHVSGLTIAALWGVVANRILPE